MAVFDAGVVFRWLIDDPLSDAAIAIRARHAPIAPKLLLVEIANALRTQVKARRLPIEVAVEQLACLPGQIDIHDHDHLIPLALRLGADWDHAVYDCLYVALALHTGAPLITADLKLSRKFETLPGLQLIRLEATQRDSHAD